jgi:hypothetical protein
MYIIRKKTAFKAAVYGSLQGQMRSACSIPEKGLTISFRNGEL